MILAQHVKDQQHIVLNVMMEHILHQITNVIHATHHVEHVNHVQTNAHHAQKVNIYHTMNVTVATQLARHALDTQIGVAHHAMMDIISMIKDHMIDIARDVHHQTVLNVMFQVVKKFAHNA